MFETKDGRFPKTYLQVVDKLWDFVLVVCVYAGGGGSDITVSLRVSKLVFVRLRQQIRRCIHGVVLSIPTRHLPLVPWSRHCLLGRPCPEKLGPQFRETCARGPTLGFRIVVWHRPDSLTGVECTFTTTWWLDSAASRVGLAISWRIDKESGGGP